MLLYIERARLICALCRRYDVIQGKDIHELLLCQLQGYTLLCLFNLMWLCGFGRNSPDCGLVD